MKLVTTCVFHCDNDDEYLEALNTINDELADMEVMNEICDDEATMEVYEDKDNLQITTISTYIK